MLGIFSMSYAQIPTLGLVAHYPFNGNANDSSGSGNNGTVYGATPTTDRFGNPNKAYSFNGSNYILVPNSTSLNPSSQFSISVWVQTTSSHSNAGIVGKWNQSTGINGGAEQYVILANNSGATFAAKTNYQSTINESGIQYNNGLWHHYCGVWEGSTLKFYRDGILTSSASLTGSLPGFNQFLEIGRYTNGILSSLFFTGKIDDIRIYNRSLNTTEISSILNEPNPTLPLTSIPGSVYAYKKFSSTTGNLPFPLTNTDYFGWNAENIGDINNDGVNDLALAYPHSS